MEGQQQSLLLYVETFVQNTAEVTALLNANQAVKYSVVFSSSDSDELSTGKVQDFADNLPLSQDFHYAHVRL